MARHLLHALPNGEWTVKHVLSGQTMHSAIGPWTEARSVYIEQSRLEERLQASGGPLVIYDVGLGIAANSLAALERCLFMRSAPAATARPQLRVPVRALHLLSFESDLEGLRLALHESARLPFIERHRGKLEALLADGRWEAPGVRWQVIEGDFLTRDLSPLPPADLVYYDFYAPKIAPALWSVEALKKVAAKLRPAPGAGHSDLAAGLLITYSAASAVKSALTRAGLTVEKGQGTALKKETTLARRRDSP